MAAIGMLSVYLPWRSVAIIESRFSSKTAIRNLPWSSWDEIRGH